jgi:hypothetical protein
MMGSSTKFATDDRDRAEIERLRTALIAICALDGAPDAISQILALANRTLNEPLVPWKEIAAQSIDHTEAVEAERDELRAENERLRAALRQISGYAHITAQIARATLDVCQT